LNVAENDHSMLVPFALVLEVFLFIAGMLSGLLLKPLIAEEKGANC